MPIKFNMSLSIDFSGHINFRMPTRPWQVQWKGEDITWNNKNQIGLSSAKYVQQPCFCVKSKGAGQMLVFYLEKNLDKFKWQQLKLLRKNGGNKIDHKEKDKAIWKDHCQQGAQQDKTKDLFQQALGT